MNSANETVSRTEPNLIDGPTPTLIHTTSAPSPSEPTNSIDNSSSSDLQSSQFTFHDSLLKDDVDLDASTAKIIVQRTTISSIFLKNLTYAMDHEVAELFSITVLDFLRDYSTLGALSERIDFILVDVVGQGPELGDSTEFEVQHIDGMHVFFETVVNVKGDKQIDLPRLMEMIFKSNKNDFIVRLVESNDYFRPLSAESHIAEEKVERQITATNFVSSWVVSSLAVVVCSVFFTTMLLTRMVRRTRPTRNTEDASKPDIYPLETLEQTYSDDSSQTSKKDDPLHTLQQTQSFNIISQRNKMYDPLPDLEHTYSDDSSVVLNKLDDGNNENSRALVPILRNDSVVSCMKFRNYSCSTKCEV
jgi:hypothetical protein